MIEVLFGEATSFEDRIAFEFGIAGDDNPERLTTRVRVDRLELQELVCRVPFIYFLG